MPGSDPLTPLPSAAVLAAALAESHDETPPTATADTRHAGVLLLMFDVDGRPHTILTKRADHLAHHPGQVSLPGGRYEPVDGSLARTALRETREEIGVPEEHVRIVRQLAPVHTRVSGFLVTPFIGLAVGSVEPTPCDREISRIMRVPLDDIVDADSRLPRFPTVATLRYPLDGEDVWGATARILCEFTRVLRRTVSARR